MSKLRIERVVLLLITIIGCIIGVNIVNDSVGIIGILAELDTSIKTINFMRLLKLSYFYNVLIVLFFTIFSVTIFLFFDNYNNRKKIRELELKLDILQSEEKI